MRAAVAREYGGPGVLEVVDMPEPQPQPGQVLVRVRASSLNPIDVKLRAGTYRRVMPLAFPAVLGYDFAGEVESAAGGWAKGDRVYGRVDAKTGGAHAQLVAVGAGVVDRVPGALTFEEAAALPLAAMTAIQAFEQVGLRAGERLLVNGAGGGVGSLAMQIGVAMGAEVAGVVRAPGSADGTLPGDGRAFDVILDTVFDRPTPGLAGRLAPRGRYVTTGFSPMLLARGVLARLWSKQRFACVLSRADGEFMRRLSSHVAAGKLRPVIEATFPLERIAEAHERLERGHARGKLVIVMP